MAIDLAQLNTASKALHSAILLGQSWRSVLEDLAKAAGAKAVAFSRSGEKQIKLLPSQGLEEPYSDICSGRTPPYSSKVLILRSNDFGFLSDAAPEIRERLERETFFRDYMKPLADIPYRASASLVGPNDNSGVKLSFWRSARQGCFEANEISLLNRVLPRVRAAVQFAQYGFAQQARERAVMFQRRGEFVFKIDFTGRPFDENCKAIVAHGDPLTVVRGRLATALSREQDRLDALIRRALAPIPQSGAIPLVRKSDGARCFLLIMPVCGESCDVLAPAAALGVLIDPEKEFALDRGAVARLQMAVGLTGRETEIAGLVSIGLPLNEIAGRIGIGMGTVRNHAKSIMQKCGVHSQVELATLIGRFG